VLAENHLILQLIRLKAPEEWVNRREGLCFLFLRGGAGKCSAGTAVHRLGPGDVLVLNGVVGGKLGALDHGDLVFSCFSLCFEHLFPLIAAGEISLVQNVTEALKGVKVYPASSAAALECHRLLQDVPPQFNLDHRSQLLRVASVILSLEFKSAQPQRVGFVRSDEHMVQVFEALSSAELLSLSVGELAERFGCSRRHLNRLFHQHFGISVSALRMEMRLLKAASLLRNPDAKVINVAEACGFNHLGLFNTCFKKRFGTSPGHWRKGPMKVENYPPTVRSVNDSCSMRANGLCPWADKPEGTKPPPEPTPPARKGAPVKALKVPDEQQPEVGPDVALSPQAALDRARKRVSSRPSP
jgi:AraC-like DNA-binding protein